MKESKSHRSSKKKHKKEKQTKKHKKHKKRDKSSSPSSDSSSGSDGGPVRGSALSQLERERAAVQAARYLRDTQPAVFKSFRELLWELDNGRAVGLAGVPDALLRAQLQHTLALLGLKLTKLLAAAAAYHADIEAAGGYEQELEPLVGPPPPDFVDEADAAPADAREAQVVRVLRVLREAAAAAAGGAARPAAAAGGDGAGPSMDPYAVLGVESTADSASIRKSYWRLSLLVHPDKCSHPAAQEVFQAVSKAAQLLQDTQQRAAHDAAQAEAALRQQAVAAAAAAEREAAQPAARDTWMTDLPTQQDRSAASVLAAGLSQLCVRCASPYMVDTLHAMAKPIWCPLPLLQCPAVLCQVSQTSFNRFGSKKPGDTSGWTDTPQQAAQRAAGLLPAAGPAVHALTGPSISGAAAEGAPVPAELLAAMAKYNKSHRHKSLLEQHAEQGQQGRKKARGSKEKEKEREMRDEKKEKSKDKSKDKSSRKEKEQDSKGQKRKASGEPEKEAWQGKHPWQPWDRDKDLEVQMQRPKAAGDLLKAAGNLSSRFSSGGR
ncbi:hypothetical protein COO60DRAFT_1456472 [Scenedesmus sp. NREL 46B-D3]|nr:hypothetical protein COO60DRAFT_1456472 [Scenedesmus sp. NREL 46B-D3]